MKRTVLAATLLATGLAAGLAGQQPAPSAPGPAPSAPGVPAGGPPAPAAPGRQGGGGNPAAISNERAGVNIDRFIGYPAHAPAHLSHGGLLTHAILRAGDPYAPGAPGAVLEYRKELVTADLPSKNRTALMGLPDQYLYYVTSGQGRLDDGRQFWDLHEGMAVLVPPTLPRRFTTTSDAPLTMVMVNWTPEPGSTRADILVRDTAMLPYCEENAHWNNMSKCIFRAADGLFRGERFYLVLMQPWAMAEPHTHTPGTEEVWTKLNPGTSVILLGSELRELPQHGAYLVPPTGITQHANLNLSKTATDAWLYMARGRATPAPAAGAAPATQAPAPGAAAGRGAAAGGGNPNLFLDQASAELGTVAGKPLPR